MWWTVVFKYTKCPRNKECTAHSLFFKNLDHTVCFHKKLWSFIFRVDVSTIKLSGSNEMNSLYNSSGSELKGFISLCVISQNLES